MAEKIELEKLEEDIIRCLGSFVSKSVVHNQFNDIFLKRFPEYEEKDATEGLQNLLKVGYITIKDGERTDNPVYSLTAKALQKFARLIKPEEESRLQPILNGVNVLKIHPMLYFTNTACYVGVFLPCLNKETKEYIEALCLITGKKEVFAATKENLKHRNMILEATQSRLEPRWSLQSIKQFVNGEGTSTDDLFEKIESLYRSYIDFPSDEIYKLFTLWIIGTYIHPLFRSFPYIYIGGIKETGKTKALQVTSCLAFNSIFSGNMSSSAIFRLIQTGRCTLLIDETEYLDNPDRKVEFRNILLNGYKAGLKVYRTERNARDRFRVQEFEPYSPKILANIRGLEDVLESRCISMVMQRTLNRDIGNRGIEPNDAVWQETRDNLYLFVMNNWKEIKKLYEEMENETSLASREWELWKPILTLAKFFDEGLYRRMIELGEEKAKERKIENMTETGENVLVETLVRIVKVNGYYRVKDIASKMKEKFDEEENWLNTSWVGRALKRLGFTNKRRVGTGIEYFFNSSAVEELADRLGVVITPSQATEDTQGSLRSEACEAYEPSVGVENNNYIFISIENPDTATCSYCGAVKELVWKDSKGNYLCEDCKREEEVRK